MKENWPVLIFRPNKSSALWLLLGSSLFVAGGLWIAQEQGWMGYVCAGFFALCIPIAIVQLLPGSTWLQLNQDGITFANLFRVSHFPWNVFDDFFVVSMSPIKLAAHKLVAFDFVPSYDRTQLLRRANSMIANCEGALPSTYGKSAEELVDILNECLTRFKQAEDEHNREPNR